MLEVKSFRSSVHKRNNKDVSLGEIDGSNKNNANRSENDSGSGNINFNTKEQLNNVMQKPKDDGPIKRLMRHARNQKKRRSQSAPPTRNSRKRLLEDHFCVTPDKKVVLPGVPKHDDDWARDSHDYFNLIILIPICILNAMNWNWNMICDLLLMQAPAGLSITDTWTGEWFHVFFYVTALYFVVDLLWVVSIPRCVKSPATIIQHHLATILYIMIPLYVEESRWCMGACMSVEINTWFLIARRVFNKQGTQPWIIDLSFVSFRVKVISTFFYLTWITIRCILYPYLIIPFYYNWMNRSIVVGTKWNLLALSLPLHLVFCLLNLKWSYDLLMSKIRYWKRGSQYKQEISKGL